VDADSLSIFILDNKDEVVVVVVEVGVGGMVDGAMGAVEVEVEDIGSVRVGVEEEEREAFSDEDNKGSKLAIEVIADNVDASEVADRETGVVKEGVKEEDEIFVDNNDS